MPVRTGRHSANLPGPGHGAFQRMRRSKYLQVEERIAFLFFPYHK